MRIALCLSGLIGNAEKWLQGAELDYRYGHLYLKKSILDFGNVDVFIHSYSLEHQEGIEQLYKPVVSVFEPNLDFKLRDEITKEELPTPYAYCLKACGILGTNQLSWFWSMRKKTILNMIWCC